MGHVQVAGTSEPYKELLAWLNHHPLDECSDITTSPRVNPPPHVAHRDNQGSPQAICKLHPNVRVIPQRASGLCLELVAEGVSWCNGTLSDGVHTVRPGGIGQVHAVPVHRRPHISVVDDIHADFIA